MSSTERPVPQDVFYDFMGLDEAVMLAGVTVYHSHVCPECGDEWMCECNMPRYEVQCDMCGREAA